MGWDYLVEMPFDARRGDEPFDKRHKVPDMKVQVKTIWADNVSVDLELIAAERLARWEYPSFIVILRMNIDKSYRDAYVIHLFGDNLARILRALRRVEAENGRSIKNRTLTFNIDAGTRIAVNGDDLAQELRRAIGNNEHDYAARKRDQLDNLGFGSHRVQACFDLAVRDNEEVLNVLLGMQPGRATRIEADEIRFDIRTTLIRDTGTRIEVKPKSKGACQVVVSSTRDYKRVVFDTELYFADLGGSGRPWKMRVLSDLVELAFSTESDSCSFRVGVRQDGRYTLDERISMIRFHRIVVSGASTVDIRMQNKKLLSFKTEPSPFAGTPESLKDKLDFLMGLRDFMAEFGLGDLRLTDKDIRENIEGITFVLGAQRSNNAMEITLSGGLLDKTLDISDLQEGLFASRMEFPGATIAFWARMRAEVRMQGGLMQMQCREFVLRDAAVVDDDDAFDAWVRNASESSGIDCVVRTDRLDSADPPVAPVPQVGE